MGMSSCVSPFSIQNTTNDWIIWERPQSIISLTFTPNADSQSVNTDDESDATMYQAEPISYPQIQRPQYNAVLERFSRANKSKGAFSDWTT